MGGGRTIPAGGISVGGTVLSLTVAFIGFSVTTTTRAVSFCGDGDGDRMPSFIFGGTAGRFDGVGATGGFIG